MKKIDIAIQDWFCYDDEEWTKAFKTISIDEAFMRADFDYYDLEDLIKYLRKHCD